MTLNNLLLENRRIPPAFLFHSFHVAIHDRHAGQSVTQTASWQFGFEEFAEAGHCQARLTDNQFHATDICWGGPDTGIVEAAANAVWDVTWNACQFQVYRISADTDCGQKTIHWIIADTKTRAREFFTAVCQWNEELREVVLNFSDGYWKRSRRLYQSIRSTSFDSLVFPAGFVNSIVSDLEMFLASRERYRQYGVPWKRGLIFVGPPGNGKTGFVKALINRLGVPCFYVRSFETENGFDSTGIQDVYRTVRNTKPAILVLEDLDALINSANRSCFLNELDGFECNDGIITIATTNYPERLGQGILDRPSRFDRMWYFGLPDSTARHQYFASWNRHLPATDQLTAARIEELVALTPDFSYASLKELCLGGVLMWVQQDHQVTLPAALRSYLDELARKHACGEAASGQLPGGDDPGDCE